MLNSLSFINDQKLRWRCRRGMKELDVVFERFLSHSFSALSAEERNALSHLLDETDQDLYDWIAGRSSPMKPEFKALITLLQTTSGQLPWKRKESLLSFDKC